MAVDVVVHGKWKNVELEPSLFLQKDFNHLICIEELTDYSIVDRKNTEVACKSFVLYYCSHSAIYSFPMIQSNEYNGSRPRPLFPSLSKI